MKVDIRTGRSNPFQVALLLVSLLSGGLGLVLGSPATSSLRTAAPGGSVTLFYVLTFLGALVALFGMWAPQRLEPHRLEQAGLIGLAGCWLSYGGVVLLSGALPAGSLLFGFGVACLERVFQIKREVRQSRGLNALIEPEEGERE